MNTLRGARPIPDKEIKSHYDKFSFNEVSLNEYKETWLSWIHNTALKSIQGLDAFNYFDYTAGTSHAFDHFVIKNSSKTILALKGDFQYHHCISKFNKFQYIDYSSIADLEKIVSPEQTYAMIISVPFSDLGCVHPDFDTILKFCSKMNISVLLDLAYWGIGKNIHINLNNYPCVDELAFSLSKSFYTLENHRVGIRFTKKYVDDGISMLNEVEMYNKYSMSLGVHYMNKFDADWNWNKYQNKYKELCTQEKLSQTDTVIFGLGDKERHSHFNRGIPNNYRICISNKLGDVA